MGEGDKDMRMSPLGIEMMLHYYCSPTDFDYDSDAAKDSVVELTKAGLLEALEHPNHLCFHITERGRVYVLTLLATPVPSDIDVAMVQEVEKEDTSPVRPDPSPIKKATLIQDVEVVLVFEGEEVVLTPVPDGAKISEVGTPLPRGGPPTTQAEMGELVRAVLGTRVDDPDEWHSDKCGCGRCDAFSVQ